jgi:hypothetical protein
MINAVEGTVLADARIGVQGFIQTADGSYPVDFETTADSDGYIAFRMPLGSVGTFTYWQSDAKTGQVIASPAHTIEANGEGSLGYTSNGTVAEQFPDIELGA